MDTPVQTRRTRWEQRTEPALIVAALVFLGAYAAPIIHPGISEGWRNACAATTLAVWALFGLDYLTRLALSGNRLRFIGRNIFDLIILVLPMLRPLRLLRLLTLLSIAHRVGAPKLRGRVVIYATAGTVILLGLSGLAITDTERGAPGAQIESLGDGLWWSITTMTTVGYGDLVPVTTTGRFVAAALMIAGIALLGVVTATFASWLIERVDESAKSQDATHELVQSLRQEIQRLNERLDAIGPRLADTAGDRDPAAPEAEARPVPDHRH
ncbi:potassium channel family protein [Nocardia mangyaensis]|uniref:potassium channel family protein n=1 Tax=Nocardia mangyaensis TaxID=2213200 RepID=UPI0026767124|nr:potassium channel family protein [Nocardia mangyaensis]MDO3649306.1 ion channel [Nocardia mangyaensis]